MVIRELEVTEDWKNGLLRFSPTIAFQSRNETLLRETNTAIFIVKKWSFDAVPSTRDGLLLTKGFLSTRIMNIGVPVLLQQAKFLFQDYITRRRFF